MAVDQNTATVVADQASNVASTAAQSGRQVGNEAANQASEVMRQTKEQVHSLMNDTKQEIRTQAQQRGEQAAKSLHTFSDQLASLAEGRVDAAGPLPDYIRDAEGRVRDLATRLQTRGPDGVVADLGDFARRRPGTFLLGAAAAGFLIGRVVRAGKAQQGTGTQSDWSPPYGEVPPYAETLAYTETVPYTESVAIVSEVGTTPAFGDGEAVPTGGGG